jgi:hypothetical protein
MRAITITGWQRPHLFRSLLRSLAANDLRGWSIFIQLEPSEFVEDFRTAAAEILSATPTSIVVNAERLGVRLNPYRLLSRVFNEGADLVLYLEEDLLLSDDVTALAQWYANNHRPEWMSLSLLSGGCGSQGFISDRKYPDILFAGKSFNSLGFVVRRDEWWGHVRPAWFADQPTFYDIRGEEISGWDWAVYHHLFATPGLYSLQTAAARATHTGREGGVYCLPEWHDTAFEGLELAEASAASRNYRVLTLAELPAPLRRQAVLWDQVNCALNVITERTSQLNALLLARPELISQPKSAKISALEIPPTLLGRTDDAIE